MDIYNLTKPQKKICRQLIETALNRECAGFIDELSDIVAKVKKNDKTPLENYHRVYKAMDSFDRIIAKTYDNLGGSRYFITVVSLYKRGVLTDDDIEVLDEDLLTRLRFLLSM